MFVFLTLFLICVVLFCFWYGYYLWHYRKLTFDGPKQLPIIGNVYDFDLNPVAKLNTLIRLSKEHDYLYKLSLGPSDQYLVVADPKMMEFVMSSQKLITKSIDYDFFFPWLGKGLLTSTGSYWHKKRKILTPSFHFRILEEFIPVFDSLGQVFVEKLSEKNGKASIDVYPFVTAYTLDTICETAMGTTVDAQNKDSAYVRAIGDMRGIFLRRIFSLWKRFDALFVFSDDYKLEKKCLEIIIGFTRSVIEKKKKEKLMSNSNKKIEEDEFGRKKRLAFLDLLLESKINGRNWTEEEIREEVDTFMFEGHDTTASAISFCMYELAHHQDIQDKVVCELESIFGKQISRPITNQDIQKMIYLDLVIKETLRMYPSVPIMGRQVVEEVKYEGITLPTGLNIILFPLCMQRRDDLFENAMEFNPDRFLSDQMNKSNPFSYVPFSAGPRNCIGQKFAMMEMKCAMAKLLMSLKLKPGEGKYPLTELSGEIILKSEGSVYLTVEKR